MQKGPASQALSFLGIRATACQLCLGLSSFSDLWEPYFGPPSLDLILTLGFCPQVYASSRPLRVGYYETDKYTMPTPAMKRAVLETKQSLEAAGHTVWLWEPGSPGTAPPSGKPSRYCGCHLFPASLHPDCFVVGMGTMSPWDPWIEG